MSAVGRPTVDELRRGEIAAAARDGLMSPSETRENDPTLCSPGRLPLMAFDAGLSGWDEAWPEAKKRELVREAYRDQAETHRRYREFPNFWSAGGPNGPTSCQVAANSSLASEGGAHPTATTSLRTAAELGACPASSSRSRAETSSSNVPAPEDDGLVSRACVRADSVATNVEKSTP